MPMYSTDDFSSTVASDSSNQAYVCTVYSDSTSSQSTSSDSSSQLSSSDCSCQSNTNDSTSSDYTNITSSYSEASQCFIGALRSVFGRLGAHVGRAYKQIRRHVGRGTRWLGRKIKKAYKSVARTGSRIILWTAHKAKRLGQHVARAAKHTGRFIRKLPKHFKTIAQKAADAASIAWRTAKMAATRVAKHAAWIAKKAAHATARAMYHAANAARKLGRKIHKAATRAYRETKNALNRAHGYVTKTVSEWVHKGGRWIKRVYKKHIRQFMPHRIFKNVLKMVKRGGRWIKKWVKKSVVVWKKIGKHVLTGVEMLAKKTWAGVQHMSGKVWNVLYYKLAKKSKFLRGVLRGVKKVASYVGNKVINLAKASWAFVKNEFYQVFTKGIAMITALAQGDFVTFAQKTMSLGFQVISVRQRFGLNALNAVGLGKIAMPLAIVMDLRTGGKTTLLKLWKYLGKAGKATKFVNVLKNAGKKVKYIRQAVGKPITVLKSKLPLLNAYKARKLEYLKSAKLCFTAGERTKANAMIAKYRYWEDKLGHVSAAANLGTAAANGNTVQFISGDPTGAYNAATMGLDSAFHRTWSKDGTDKDWEKFNAHLAKHPGNTFKSW